MLSEEQIIRYIEIVRADGTVENPKVELKREWWRLDSDEGQDEFVKDVTAMANTLGEDGYIIIGLEEKGGQIYNAPFPTEGNHWCTRRLPVSQSD